jgi:branched-chain amino acid transport system permease protein
MEKTGTIKKSPLDRLTGNLPATTVVAASLLLVVVIGMLGGPAQVVQSIVTGGMWALLALGLALVFGVMNISNFAHGESFMVGTYVAYFTFSPLNDHLKTQPSAFLQAIAPFAGFLASFLVGAVLNILLDRLFFAPMRTRTRSGWIMNAFLLTTGASFVMINSTRLLLGPNIRGIPRYWDVEPLRIFDVIVAVDRVVAFAIAILTITAVWFILHRTRTGRAIRAVSQDEVGAQLMGINLGFIHTLTFSLATASAALAGACLLFMFQAYPTVGLKPLYFAWYVVMLSGLGNVAGAIVGGFIVAVLQTATQQFIGVAWEDVVPTALMIIMLIVVPSGIFGSEVKGVHEQ